MNTNHGLVAISLLLGGGTALAQEAPVTRPPPDTVNEIGGQPTPGEPIIDSGVGEDATPGAEAVEIDPDPLDSPTETTDDIAGKPTPDDPVDETVTEEDCAAFGEGYSSIPGTSTCLRIGGYVRFDSGFGDLNGADTDDPADAEADTWAQRARFALNTYTSGETRFGRLNTFTEVRFNYGDVVQTNPIDLEPQTPGVATRTSQSDTTLNFAWIELGGVRLGKGESLFLTFTDYAGAVINDTTVGGYGFFDTEFVQYTYAPEDGALSAAIGLENGADDYLIDDYVPHVVLAAGARAAAFVARASLAWDSRDDEDFDGNELGGLAAKLRADVELSDTSSLFLMGLYGENSSGYTTWATGGVDEDTGSVIAGHTATLGERLVSNSQLQWAANNDDGDDLYGIAANLAYEIVPGVALTGELQWLHDAAGDDDFGGVLRAQASF